MDRHERAAQNVRSLEQRWGLEKGREYVVDQGSSGFIAQYHGHGIFRAHNGQEFYPMPAHVREIIPR
jgi:hypothetical protein